MGWNATIVTVTHDVSDGSPSARSSRPYGHIAVGCDAPRRNTPYNGQHASGKQRRVHANDSLVAPPPARLSAHDALEDEPKSAPSVQSADIEGDRIGSNGCFEGSACVSKCAANAHMLTELPRY